MQQILDGGEPMLQISDVANRIGNNHKSQIMHLQEKEKTDGKAISDTNGLVSYELFFGD